MPRLLNFAAPLISCLVLAAGPVHAQSTAFLYVGADSSQLNTGFGTATVSAAGTSASGKFAFLGGAGLSTTDYKGLSAFGDGHLTVTGGTFQQLFAADSGVINLIGYNLTQSSDFQFDASNNAFYTISGTLQQEQTPFTAEWIVPGGGTLEFDGVPAVPGADPVPEASTTVSFGLLLVGAAWLIVKRRKVAV